MSWTSGLAIYFVLWWIVLFAVLPWGVRSQEESGDYAAGTDPGAPAVPHLRAKLIATTLVSGVIFAGMYAAYVNRWVTLDGLASVFGFAPR